ncbi:TetR/AcrR family transcriptional regulator [Chitinophagaceae bacterium 26-R-25]|nr:TetR/AcrR family transcriptional regulator [Chitinophagaceae bacterium 26-R-25]
MTKKEDVKNKIGKAAMQCFAKFGLDKTTLGDIAKVVGLNKATLYYYYKNKEDIFLEIAVSEGEEYLAKLQQQTIRKKGIENQIWFYMYSRFNYYKNVLNMNRVSAETLNKILPKFFELYDSMMKQEKKFLTQLIETATKNGELVKSNATKIASTLINLSDALKHSEEQKSILRGEDKIDYTQSITDMKFLVTLIFTGLKKK